MSLPEQGATGERIEIGLSATSATSYPDDKVILQNPNIQRMGPDNLIHLALSTYIHNLPDMFGDVKFVCLGGSPQRMADFANYLAHEIIHQPLHEITASRDRYSIYKVGPVLCVSHGMGGPSAGILLNELFKLMFHAGCLDPVFIRIGTCGGLGIAGGTVVISDQVVDGMQRDWYDLPVLGEIVRRPTKLDLQLADELKQLADLRDHRTYETVCGKTMCTDDFYEGQARLDGAFCGFDEAQVAAYLNKINRSGVINIEMEGAVFSALTHQAGIRAAMVCVTMRDDRLKGTAERPAKEVTDEWQQRPQQLVAQLIQKYLGK